MSIGDFTMKVCNLIQETIIKVINHHYKVQLLPYRTLQNITILKQYNHNFWMGAKILHFFGISNTVHTYDYIYLLD